MMWVGLFVVLLACKIIGIGTFSAWWLLLPVVIMVLPITLFIILLPLALIASLYRRWVVKS